MVFPKKSLVQQGLLGTKMVDHDTSGSTLRILFKIYTIKWPRDA